MKSQKSSHSVQIVMAAIIGGLALSGVALLALVYDTLQLGLGEIPLTRTAVIVILLTQHVVFLCLLRARNWISEKMIGGESE